MKLSDGQRQVASDPKRFRTVIAGRRWGKTFLSIRELCYAARQPNTLCWYVSPSYKMSRNIVWRPLKDRLRDLNWIRKVNETNLEIELKNGSIIALKGADNFDSLRGSGIGGILILDEFADIDPEAWYSVLRPTLSDKMGRALFIGTPKGIGNWSYDIFNQSKTNPAWSSYTFTTLSGGNVPASEILQAKQDLDEKTFRQEYEATFETYSGVIYFGFDRESNVVPMTEYDLSAGEYPLNIFVGMDQNIDPMSAVIGYTRPDGRNHIFDYLKIYGSNTDEVAQELKNRYPRAKITVYPDPSGRQRRSSAGGMTDILILQNAGLVVKAPNNHPPVKDRIAAVNSRLRTSTGEINLFIDPRCKPVIDSLERQVYKENTQIPEKDGWDHMNDALGYWCHYCYPIKRERTTGPELGVWRHRIGA